jgi:hypothetical protein
VDVTLCWLGIYRTIISSFKQSKPMHRICWRACLRASSTGNQALTDGQSHNAIDHLLVTGRDSLSTWDRPEEDESE